MIGYLDCSTGVSGDKFLGALLDLGEGSGAFTVEDLRDIATRLAPEAVVVVERVGSHGISALGVRVRARTGEPHSRTWASIRLQILAADLPGPVGAHALAAFEALATAEAAVHGVDVDDIHFHEVGALDSIVDVVGVCAGMYALGIERLVASRVAVGSGTVETSHGVLPVPSPATAALLEGVPIETGPSASELTTPTGAALLRTLAESLGTMPPMSVTGTGYGAGTRDIGLPNVCRLLVGEPLAPADALSSEPVVLLETNIDHLSAEELAFAAEELLGGGALDVWQTPIVMKKGRSAVMLSALATPAAADAVTERLVRLTGTLGVRRETLERSVADREVREVTTEWGPARVKVGAGRIRPEHDDVARIARRHGLPYRVVAEEIARLAGKRQDRTTQQ